MRVLNPAASGAPPASPSPAVPTQALTQAQQIQAANQAAAAGGTGSASLYGLGDWKGQKIDPSGFPPQLQLLLTKAGVDLSQPLTAETLAATLAKVHDPATISQLQQMLYYSGAYPASITALSKLTLGSFGAPDITALGNAITTSGQTGQAFGTYLSTSANLGKAQGILGTLTGLGKTPVALPNPLDEDTVLRSEAQQLLGRTPDATDLAGFRAFANQYMLAGSKAAATAAAQGNAANLPDTQTLGTAIGDTTQNPDGTFTSNLPSTVTDASVPHGVQAGGGPGLPNPQIAADQGALNSVLGAGAALDAGGNQNVPSYTAAPDLSAAADQFLQNTHGTEIAQQSALGKYTKLIAFMKSGGV